MIAGIWELHWKGITENVKKFNQYIKNSALNLKEAIVYPRHIGFSLSMISREKFTVHL